MDKRGQSALKFLLNYLLSENLIFFGVPPSTKAKKCIADKEIGYKKIL